jgi:hypothetical protein
VSPHASLVEPVPPAALLVAATVLDLVPAVAGAATINGTKRGLGLFLSVRWAAPSTLATE